jgi:hypothetical protein
VRGPTPGLGLKYPIKDFINLSITNYGFFWDDKYKLANFLYPAKKQPAKGIVFAFHGLHSYSNRSAHIAQKFSEKGFDVAAFD